MGENKELIRYKYRETKEGFSLKNVCCPICESNHINWVEVVQNKNWDGTIVLLAECWSGNTDEEKPKHLFLIRLDNLPTVEIEKIKSQRGRKK